MTCSVVAPPTPTGQGSTNDFQQISLREERDSQGSAPSIGVVLVPQVITQKSFLRTQSGDPFATRNRPATEQFLKSARSDCFFDGILSLTECECLHFVDTR